MAHGCRIVTFCRNTGIGNIIRDGPIIQHVTTSPLQTWPAQAQQWESADPEEGEFDMIAS